MGQNVHDVLRKFDVYYTRKHKNVEKHKLVMIWNYYQFKRRNIKFTRNKENFKNSYLLKNDEEKTCHVLG
jgi:hypothetical protein